MPGLKKRNTHADPRTFCEQCRNNKPKHKRSAASGSRLHVSRGPGDQRGCQRWLTLRPFRGQLPQCRGPGEWACFLFIGSDFSGRGLFVYSARPMPCSLPWPQNHSVGPASGVAGGLASHCPGVTYCPPRSMRTVCNVEIQAQGCK